MIKAVLLDLDDTLILTDTDNFFPAYLKRLGAHAAGFDDPQQFVNRIMGTFVETLNEDDPTRPLYDRLMEKLAADGRHERKALEDLFGSFYRDAYQALNGWIQPRPASRRLLDFLFAQRKRVVVATNPGLPEAAIHHRMRWGNVAPEDYPFSLVTTLEAMHFGKPRPEYYAEIVWRLAVEPGEALMAGNDWEADIVPAAAAGLHAYWISDAGSSPPGEDITLAGWGTYEDFVDWVLAGSLDGLPENGAKAPAALLYRLAASPAAIDALRRPHPPEVLECCPGDDEWSARDIVCHLRDHEAEEQARLARVLHEENPFLSANLDPWAGGQTYQRVTFEAAFQVFVARRLQTVDWLRSLPLEAWDEPARDAIFGPSKFGELVAFIAEHDRTHHEQMRRAIADALRTRAG